MKHWQETAAVFEGISSRGNVSCRCALASVVRISGSAYRRPGAKLLVDERGETFGGVSGGCLETDVREVALQAMRKGRPRLLHYDTGADEETVWGLGLGCDGAVDILVQPVDEPFQRLVVSPALERMAAAQQFLLATVVRGPREGRGVVWAAGVLSGTLGDAGLDRALAAEAPGLLVRGESALCTLGADELFAEALVPPPVLLVFGAGDDARPLVRLALEVGLAVTVIDHRPAYLTAARFPAPARLLLRRSEEGLPDLPLGPRHCAVVQSHGMVHDRRWLAALLERPVAYVGLLGSRRRCRDLLAEVPAQAAARVFAPVGLDLGADGPEQVAVSIVAELLAFHSGRTPGHLRAREGAIHP